MITGARIEIYLGGMTIKAAAASISMAQKLWLED